MRFLLTIIIIILSAIHSTGQNSIPFKNSDVSVDDMVTIDMRHGLSESRVRAIRSLPDGRIAVVTAGYLNIFDGTSFKNVQIDNEEGIVLQAIGKNRQLYNDNKGRIWLKTPASRMEKTGRIHIFDSHSGKNITTAVLKSPLIDDMKDLFIDDKGELWMIDMHNTLHHVVDWQRKPVINLNQISLDLPAAISVEGEYIYLCYDDGNVCVVNISTGMLRYKGAPTLPKGTMKHTNAGAKWDNGKLRTSFHRHNNLKNTWIATLDTMTWKWDTQHFDKLLYDFVTDSAGNIVTGFTGLHDEIFRMDVDHNGGLWIGTKENGLRYINLQRQGIVKQSKTPYSYPTSGYYTSDRAKAAAQKYSPGGINSSAEDSISGYIYLGAPKGLIIIDSLDNQVAILGENVGLPQHNVQSVVANVPYSGNTADSSHPSREVWFSTTTGLSRLRHIGRDTFEVMNLGILDGLDLKGAEFYSQSMVYDSTGTLLSGYPGGTYMLKPGDIADKYHVLYHYPDTRNPDEDMADSKYLSAKIIVVILILIMVLTSIGIYLFVRAKKQKSGMGSPAPTESPSLADNELDRVYDNLLTKYRETKPTLDAPSPADKEFVNRLNKIVREHLDDENLNVVSLSSLMAMDRTNLYRKMQSAVGKSPSVYIKNMRLTTAAKLLKETDIPIPEIARTTGFSSTKYFSSTFKESFGILPATYRTNSRKPNS